jgi:hypothetical protein
LDITVIHDESPRYRRGSVPRITYTEEEREEFRNIRSIRLAATMPSVGCDVDRYLISLTSFIGGIPSLRHLAIYSETEPNSVHGMMGWIKEYNHFDGDRAFAYLWYISYSNLLATLKCTSPYLESLTLPTGLWALPSAIPQPPATFCHFEGLQYLGVPRQALLGTKAISLSDSFLDWADFQESLNEEGQWLDKKGVAHKNLFTVPTRKSCCRPPWTYC